MSHPSVVILGANRVPRRLVCGEELREVDLPPGTRVLYPRPALPGSDAPQQDIRQALDAPLGSEPLAARLRPGMRLTVALEALYHGPDALYDYTGLALGVVVELAQSRGVMHIDVVLATGLHRRLFPAERRALVRHVDPSLVTVHEHDAEGVGELTDVAVPAELSPSPLGLNRIAAQSDLLVTISVAGWPYGGGYAPLVLGLGGYTNARALTTLSASLDPRAACARLGAVLESKVAVFALQLVLDSNLTNHELSSLNRNEDDLSAVELLGLRGVKHLPRRARIELLEQANKQPRVIGVYCGDTSKTDNAARQRYVEQHAVPFATPADVVVTGLPLNTPWNAVGGSRLGGALNPVLIKHALQTLVLGRHTGAPLLREGGTVVLLHPCSSRFDHTQHTAFFDFFNQVLPAAPGVAAQKEADFLLNPALVAVFRNGHAYHPTLPFLLWQQSQLAANAFADVRVIVVGADNESVPAILGYETASSVDEALFRTRNGGNQPQNVVCLHNPLAVLCHQVEH